MRLSGFLLLLLLTAVDGDSSQIQCSYQDVLNFLNLTKDNELYSMTRPVKDYTQPTAVSLELLLYAILDVREIDQIFVPYVWIVASWQNEYIHWNPDDFCGIKTVSIPTGVLWKPDLTIEEMTEKDKAPPSPHLTIYSDGLVRVQNDQMLVSTCRMHVHKFPFDIQSCNLSFKSVVHTVKELQLVQGASTSETSDMPMRTQYEWVFINMAVTNKTVNMFNLKQDMLIYTITMKRQPLLYIVNFLLPVLFLLILDVASFLIAEREGEKLGFKVTVLLAVTVMQLLLNEILPSSSDRFPLIVVYCIGIFGLMMLSLLETILVMHLMDKDSQRKECQKPKRGVKKRAVSVCDVSDDETPTETLKVSSSREIEESCDSGKLSDELKEVLKTLTVLLSSTKEEERPGYWTRMTKTINRLFFIFYLVAIIVFLVCMFFSWTEQE